MSAATQFPTATGQARRAGATRLVPAVPDGTTRPRIPLSVLALGIVTVLVGGWGAAAPFAGPDFGFVADRSGAWTWSSTSGYLALLPGAVALVCGLLVVGAAARRSFRRRPDLWVLGLLVAACGAWFVVGQYVWPVVEAKLFIVPSAATHFMWKELAFAIGPGAILIYCGATFMGWSVRRQLAVVAAPADEAGTPGGAHAAPVPGSPAPGVMTPPPPSFGTGASAGTPPRP